MPDESLVNMTSPSLWLATTIAVPHLPRAMFLEKPSFAYWLQSAAFASVRPVGWRVPNPFCACSAASVFSGDLAPRDRRSQAAILELSALDDALVLQVQMCFATDAPLLAMAVALLSTWRLVHAQMAARRYGPPRARTSLAAAFLAKNGFGLLGSRPDAALVVDLGETTAMLAEVTMAAVCLRLARASVVISAAMLQRPCREAEGGCRGAWPRHRCHHTS